MRSLICTPRKYAGLIFVDPVSLEYWANCTPKRKTATSSGSEVVSAWSIIGANGSSQGCFDCTRFGRQNISEVDCSNNMRGKGPDLILRLVGEIQRLPQELWPTIRAHWSRPKCFRQWQRISRRFRKAPGQRRQMPIAPRNSVYVILSASNANEAELKNATRGFSRASSAAISGSNEGATLASVGAAGRGGCGDSGTAGNGKR